MTKFEASVVCGVGAGHSVGFGVGVEDSSISNSRRSDYAKCPRLFWYRHEKKWRPVVEPKSLRMGYAYHLGLERLYQGCSLDRVIGEVAAHYEMHPAFVASGSAVDDGSGQEWEYERETVLQMLRGYHNHYRDQFEVLAVELEFDLPLSIWHYGQTWRFTGRIDAIVKLPDGRTVVVEHKLLSDSIDSSSDLWMRLRIDQQMSGYILAARKLGYDVCSVLADITRKPTFKPTQTPMLDENGLKIVVNENGERVQLANGKWRQTGDESRGYSLLTRPMTTTEWGEKLAEDIAARPHAYFARMECPRVETELDGFADELEYYAKAIEASRISGIWPRNVTKECSFCPMFGPCSVGAVSDVPEGYVCSA